MFPPHDKSARVQSPLPPSVAHTLPLMLNPAKLSFGTYDHLQVLQALRLCCSLGEGRGSDSLKRLEMKQSLTVVAPTSTMLLIIHHSFALLIEADGDVSFDQLDPVDEDDSHV
jgi:hypothetical protein